MVVATIGYALTGGRSQELEQSRTIAVICLMLTERAMNRALHWDQQQGVDMRKDAGKAKQESANYL